MTENTRPAVESHDPKVPAAWSAFMRSGWGDRELDLPAHPITPYVGVWSEDDEGDVPPRYTLARGHIYMPRGLTLDPKKKTVIVSDKYTNAVLTFSLPELFDRPAARQTARAAR